MTNVSTGSGIKTTDVSPEEDHLLLISNLLTLYASTAVRVKFDIEFDPRSLQIVLNQNKFKILEPLERKRVINQSQWVLAIVKLGGISYEERCNQLKVRKFECTDQDMLKEIKNISRAYDPVHKGIRKICDKTILEWKKETVTETKAIRRLNEMISTDNVAVAVGPSGCEKNADPNFQACLKGLNYIEKLYPDTTVNTIYTQSARSNQYVYRSLPNYGRAMVLNRGSHEQCDPSYYELSKINKSHLQISICHVKYSFEPYKSYEISPLHIAARKGYTDIVEILLSHNAEHDNVTDYYQIASPLFIASNQNYLDIVSLLLKNKPSHYKMVSNIRACKNLNQREFNQSSLHISLHIAVEKGHYEIVGLFRKCTKDSYNYHKVLYRDMADIAKDKGQDKIVELLLNQPLFKSICESKTETVKLL
ncbi:unnamed protein product [Mytilus coruscus]|uniref:Uncharacterized protein n=1 Tax=Mytilus coruscus TaxID=42192 RepID=A0A6J8BZF5_MYTCO|nr:unnamed protein product [Mytilus coruscus]